MRRAAHPDWSRERRAATPTGPGLVRALRAAGCDAEFYGVGGAAMAAAGVDADGGQPDLAVVGLTEVARPPAARAPAPAPA